MGVTEQVNHPSPISDSQNLDYKQQTEKLLHNTAISGVPFESLIKCYSYDDSGRLCL